MTRTPTAILALALLTGCQTFRIEPPADFCSLEEREYSAYAQRATTADGVVLATRELDNENEGTLEFWTTALRDRLRLNQGYALLSEQPVTCASGEAGRQLRFGRDQDGEPYDYWVTLFVTEPTLGPSHLYLVECGGKREAFASRQEALARAIQEFEID